MRELDGALRLFRSVSRDDCVAGYDIETVNAIVKEIKAELNVKDKLDCNTCGYIKTLDHIIVEKDCKIKELKAALQKYTTIDHTVKKEQI